MHKPELTHTSISLEKAVYLIQSHAHLLLDTSTVRSSRHALGNKSLRFCLFCLGCDSVSCFLYPVISPSVSPQSIQTQHLPCPHCAPHAGLTSSESEINQAGWSCRSCTMSNCFQNHGNKRLPEDRGVCSNNSFFLSPALMKKKKSSSVVTCYHTK